ncbi:hypothetical protein S245_028447, partial [Arachis hypogaea]
MCNSKVVPCDEKDKNSLFKLKHRVTDPSGIGVHCDNTTGKVTELSLTCPQIYPVYGNDVNKSHFLTGELNISSLFELQFLSSLELGNNDLNIIHYHSSGGNSSNNLHHLDLSDIGYLKADHMLDWISNLSFLYFSQTFPHFQSLDTLFLDDNDLNGSIPNWVGQFEKLKNLYLSRNIFSGPLPTGLKNLSSLTCLSLESNSFIENISENFCHSFSNLKYL